MAMQGFTHLEIARVRAGFEGRRVSVRVGLGAGRGGFHLGVEQEGFIGHVVADESNDDGVPEHGGGARQSVEQLAGKVGLAFLAEFAEAGADGGGFELWEEEDWGGEVVRGGGCGGLSGGGGCGERKRKSRGGHGYGVCELLCYFPS